MFLLVLVAQLSLAQTPPPPPPQQADMVPAEPAPPLFVPAVERPRALPNWPLFVVGSGVAIAASIIFVALAQQARFPDDFLLSVGGVLLGHLIGTLVGGIMGAAFRISDAMRGAERRTDKPRPISLVTSSSRGLIIQF